MLGVIFSDLFHFDAHVEYILKICSQRSYLMRKLWDQGLTAYQLNFVFDANILSRITYGVCAWSGFSSVELVGRIDAFFRRMFKYGFCKHLITFLELSGNYDSTLFKLMLNAHCCIHQLLPSVKKMTLCNSNQEDTNLFCQIVTQICIKFPLSIAVFLTCMSFNVFIFEFVCYCKRDCR